MKKGYLTVFLLLAFAGLAIGQNMSKPVNISKNNTYSRWGQIAFTPNGAVHIVWEDNNKVVYISYDGKKFSAPFYLKDTPGLQTDRPTIATNKWGAIFVVWDESNAMRLRQYDPSSKSWMPTEVVADGSFGAETPSVAADPSGNVYAAWTHKDLGISYSRAKINGAWEPVKRHSPDGARGKYTAVAAAGNGQVWVIFGIKDSIGNYKTHYSKRTWDSEWATYKVMNLTGGDQDRPNLAIHPVTNIPYVTFVNIDEVIGSFAGAVYVCKIDEQKNPMEIAIPARFQHYPRLTIDKYGNKHIAIQMGPGDFGTGIEYTNNIGGSWKTPVAMPHSSGWPKLAGIAAHDKNVAMVWDSLVSSTNKEIWYSSLYPVTVHNVYAPANLSAAVSFGADAASQITYTLTWAGDSRNKSLKGYKVYSRPDASTAYTPLLSVSKTTLNASFSFADINTDLGFAVSCEDLAGYESDLKEFTISYPEALGPLNLQLVISSQGLLKTPGVTYTLSWQANPGNPANLIEKYKIYKKGARGNYEFLSEWSNATFSITYSVSGEAARVSYGISAVSILGTETAIVPFVQ